MARNKLQEAVEFAAEMSRRFPVTVKLAEVRIMGTERIVGYAPFVSQVPEASDDWLHKYTEMGEFQGGQLAKGD